MENLKNSQFDSIENSSRIPLRIRKELEAATEKSFFRFVGNWLFLFIMSAGFAVGVVLWSVLEQATIENSYRFAETTEAISVITNFGIGLLIALFVWIFAASIVTSLIIRISPMPIKAALFFSGEKEFEKTVSKFSDHWKPSLDITSPNSAGEAINLSLDRYIRVSSWCVAPFAILAITITLLETRSFDLIASDGVYDGKIFSSTVEFFPWAEAETVSLGCNQTDDGGRLIYIVKFARGPQIRMTDDSSLNDQHWLVNLEKIDSTLRNEAVSFERWSWLGRDPLHPRCLRGFYAEVGPDNKYRIDRVLRVGDFEGDQSNIIPPSLN